MGNPFPYSLFVPLVLFHPLSRQHKANTKIRKIKVKRLILIILINYHFTCVSRSLLYFCCNVMTPNDAYFSVMILNHDCFRSNNFLQVQNIITESYFFLIYGIILPPSLNNYMYPLPFVYLVFSSL